MAVELAVKLAVKIDNANSAIFHCSPTELLLLLLLLVLKLPLLPILMLHP
jgi:hypothetical protein